MDHPDTEAYIELFEKRGVPGARMNLFDTDGLRNSEQLRAFAKALNEAAEWVAIAERALPIATFQGDGETCTVCEKHVSRHYGGSNRRCFPLAGD